MNSISINSPGAYLPSSSITTSSPPPMSQQLKQFSHQQRRYIEMKDHPTSAQSRLNSRQKAWLRKEVSTQISSARRMIDNASHNRKSTEFKEVSAKHLASISPRLSNPKNQLQQAKVLNAKNIKFQHPRAKSNSQQQQHSESVQKQSLKESSQQQTKQIQESPLVLNKNQKKLKQRLNIQKMLDENKVFVPSDLEALVLLYGGNSENKSTPSNHLQFSVSTNTSAISSRIAAANRSMSTGKKSARGISSHSLSHQMNKHHTPAKERARTARLVQKCYQWNRILAGMPNSGRRGSSSTPKRQNKGDIQKIKRAAADIMTSRMNNIWRKAFYCFIVNVYRGKGGERMLFSKLGYPWRSTSIADEQLHSNMSNSGRKNKRKGQSIGDQVKQLATNLDQTEENYIHNPSSLKRYINPRGKDAFDYDDEDEIRRSDLEDIALRKQMFQEESGLMDEREMPLNLQKQSIYLPNSKNPLNRTTNDRKLNSHLRQSKINQTARPADQEQSRSRSSNPHAYSNQINYSRRNEDFNFLSREQETPLALQYQKRNKNIPPFSDIYSTDTIQDLRSTQRQKPSIRAKLQNLLSEIQGGQGSPSSHFGNKFQATHHHHFQNSPEKQSRNGYPCNQKAISIDHQRPPSSMMNTVEEWDDQSKYKMTSARFHSFRQQSSAERETFGAKRLRASPIIKTKGASNQQEIIGERRVYGSSPFEYSQDQFLQQHNQAIMKSPRGATIRAKMVRFLTLLQMKLKSKFNQFAIRLSNDPSTVRAYRLQEENYYRRNISQRNYKPDEFNQNAQYETDSQSDQLRSLHPQSQFQRKQKQKQPRGGQTKQQQYYANSSSIKSNQFHKEISIGKLHASERIQRVINKVLLKRQFAKFAIVIITMTSYQIACQLLYNSIILKQKMKFFQKMKRNIRFRNVRTILGRSSKVMDNVVTKYAKQLVFTKWSNILRQSVTTQLFRICAIKQIGAAMKNSLARSFYSLSRGSLLKEVRSSPGRIKVERKRTPNEMKEIRLNAFQRLIYSEEDDEQKKIIDPDVFDGDYEENLVKFVDVQQRKMRFLKKKFFNKWLNINSSSKLKTLKFQEILEKQLVHGNPSLRMKNNFHKWKIQTVLKSKRTKLPDKKHALLAKSIQRVLLRTRNQKIRKQFDVWKFNTIILSNFIEKRKAKVSDEQQVNKTPPFSKKRSSSGMQQQVSTPLQFKKSDIKSPYVKQFKH